ncbi:hypothetical protein QTP88_010252 [Uroleucon formosanum]
MEVTEQPQTPTEQPQTSTITVPPNLLPIFIESELNFNKFVIKINELTNSSRFECKASSKGLRLQTFKSDSYRAIIKYLRENEVPHHSFQNKEDKPYRVVIKNLHPSTDISYIKSELSALGFQARNINNARHRQSKLPLPIFFIDLEPDSANSAIFKLSSLCFTIIKVEAPYPKKDIPQCLRCQSYGHTRTYCSHQPRCVRCGDLHDSPLCLKNRSEPAKCALCSGPHPANYKGCTVHKGIVKTRKLQHSNPWLVIIFVSMGKPTTPNNTTTTSNKVTTRSTSSIPPSNSDIMVALDKLRGEVLSSNKIISSTQTLQFEELKKDLKQLSLQIIELKAENTTLRSELNILKGKITSLEDAGSPSQSSHVISQVLQESFERQRCSLNTIIYGVPESSSASAAQRISDDCSSIRSLLEPHSLIIPDNSKVIRLGKVVAGKSRPIKLLCGSSESSSKLVSDFRDLVKNGIQFPTGFRIVSDKTLMQRTLLRSCYAELENRKLNGETNLEISYVNGAPQVLTESLDSLVPPDPYHPPLSINFYNNIHVPGLNSTHSFFDFDNADYINIYNFISNFDWPSTLSALSVDSAFNTLYDAFHQSVLRFVPKRHFKQSTFPVWFTSELKQILFMKKKAHVKFKSTFNPDDYRQFSLLRAHYKYLSKKLYREFVDRTELSINANPSNFWKFIKKQRFNSDIPKTLTLNGASSSNEQDAADMFAIYFKSVYSCEVVNDDVSDLKILSFDLPNNAYFTVDDVFHSLSTLSGAKNVGPDGLPGVFLFQLRSIIAYPLFLPFRRSLDEGIFPTILKFSSVTPVHKSGVKSDISNYRPISIQSHLSKLFESLVLNSIKPSVNNILIEEQHGFRPGRSTTTCNLVFSNFVFDSFKKRSQVDVVYSDLAKAFDTVNHSVLLRILETSGFGEPLLSWFGSFLVNRLQWVKLFGIKSNIFSSTSGVPQGGHLSPILFLLFVNSVRNALPLCKLLCFADDMKLFMEINSAADCENLQSSLDCFVSWCLKIGLKVNASKCRVMTFTRSRSTILFDYNISGLTIERVDNLIDLGFKLSSTLSPSPHIAMITSRAFKVLGFIMRLSKDFKLSKSLKSLYCALVRPILEYGSVVWDPYTVSDINQLERVQLRFLRFCCFVLGIPHLAHDYTNIANILGLPTLAERRRTLNLKFIRGLITNHIDSPCLLSKINFKVPSHISRSHVTFLIPTANTNYLQNEPLRRIMSLANEDPSFDDNLF